MSTRLRKRGPNNLAEKVVDGAQEVERKIETALTVLWNDLPEWQQDNHYIHSGYRPASGSYKKSFASLSYLHNESVNIYSHLGGAVLFTCAAILLYHELRPRYATAGYEDVLAFVCFFGGAAICLTMSGVYHAISNHSHTVARFGNKLDYVGIVFLITGSFIPSIYYGFYCEPALQNTYWTMICSLGIGCAAVSIFDRFRTPAWRPYRAGMFVAMGLSAVVPVIHGIKLYGVAAMQDRMGLGWLVLQGVLYILGAGLYAARWPERFSPGSFDIWGSSHQLFHILVVLAAASHLWGLLVAFDYHHGPLGVRC